MRREPYPFEKDLGAILREVRQEAGMTQRAVAEKTGIINTSVSDHERGVVHITVEYLLKFAEATGTHPVDILGYFLRTQAGFDR